MAFHENFSDLELQSLEYAILVEDVSYTSNTFPLRVIKLIPSSNVVRGSSAVNNNIFVNDAACKPITGSTISRKGHLDVKVQQGANFSYKVPGYPYSSIIPKGTKFIVSVLNSNPSTMYVTTNI